MRLATVIDDPYRIQTIWDGDTQPMPEPSRIVLGTLDGKDELTLYGDDAAEFRDEYKKALIIDESRAWFVARYFPDHPLNA